MLRIPDLIVSDISTKDEATDKIILPQSILNDVLGEYNNRDLPYPLTFLLRTHNQSTHVGVREFSAQEGTIILSTNVTENLAVKAGMAISVQLVELRKGEVAAFKPLAAGYDLQSDWKTALEGAFRSAYTTLTVGGTVRLRNGMRFLVDKLLPEDAVCIVDTDLEVDIVPLSEEQARQTVKSNAEKAVVLPIELESRQDGESDSAFLLTNWNSSAQIIIKLDSVSSDAILLLGHTSPTPRAAIWSDMSSRAHREIIISPSNADLESKPIYVVVNTPGRFSLIVTQEPEVKEELSADETLCPNCLAHVPKRSLVLHERHCLRNNKRCDFPGCTFVFRAGSEQKHWHCDACGDPGEGSMEIHKERMHTLETCECGETFSNLPTLAHHRATGCPERLVECRFCHLLVPQGDVSTVSYHDVSQGLNAHEADCGSRTTECLSCNRIVKLKDLISHMKFHNQARLMRARPSICTNQNCVHSSGLSLGLCSDCFGPLYITQDDPDSAKLMARIKRKYATQLMSGCGHDYCRNVMCATATGQKLSYTAAVAKIADLRPGRFSFCVNEVMQRKRTVADQLECEGEYSVEWCCQAADRNTDVSSARAWLGREARRLDEE